MFLTHVPAVETHFLLLGSFSQTLYKGFCLILLCFVQHSPVNAPGRPALFLGRQRVGRGAGEEETWKGTLQEWWERKLSLGYIV